LRVPASKAPPAVALALQASVMRMTMSGRSAIVFAACIVVALVALVAVPVAIDQPFGVQTPRTMAVAFVMRRWSPIVTLAGAVAMAALLVGGWRRWHGVVARIALTAACVASVATAWAARQDPFEWMFHPLPRPGFVASERASFVEPRDLVLAVTINGDAAAYPIRLMAYHHVVNDRVGGVPLAATY
jgi:hypothetical protein